MKEVVLKNTYRIKEYNPIYDYYFSKDKGWIFVTNFLSYSQAMLKRSQLIVNSIFDYEIVDC